MVTLKLKPGEQEKLKTALEMLNTRLDAKAPILLARAGHKGADYCKKNCPVVYGDLRASIGNPMKEGIFEVKKNVFGSALGVMFGTAKEQGIWVEEGTKPHIIRPVKAKMLAWPVGPVGQRIKISSGGIKRGGLIYRTKKGKITGKADNQEYRFAKEVHHPGTKAQHFMLKGVQKAVPEIVDILSGVLR